VSAAVVFDLDGTLADTATDIARSLNAVLATHNLLAVELDAVRYMIGRGPTVLIERALRHLGASSDEASVAGLSAEFVEHYAKTGHQRTTLYPGIRDCLRQLCDTGVRIGVCSNKPQGSCEALLSDLGIADLVSAVRGSAPGIPAKPDPTTLRRVLHTLAADPARTIYVGDSETDVITARAADIPVVLVNWGYSDKPVTELGADAVIDSLDDLPALRARFSAPQPPAGPLLPRSAAT
jgi:phosphoglycolate phosphatase